MIRMFSAYAQVRALRILLSFVVAANAAAAESYKIDKKESYKIDKKDGGKLFTTTAPIDVVAQPKAGAKKLASYNLAQSWRLSERPRAQATSTSPHATLAIMGL